MSEDPRPAATVILMRETSEVYLVKRHGRSGFMAGAHVFPGGRVDPEDSAYEMDAFTVAAIRETLEECGVLLVNNQSDPVAREVFDEVQGGRSFHDVIRERHLSLDASVLAPWSWWITPKAEPRRYDTRFFLARAPTHRAAPDNKEVTEGAWLTPRAALDAFAAGDIFLAPPTLATLEDLLGLESFEVAAASVQLPLQPICPLLVEGDEMVLALPGDPLHDVKERAMRQRTRFVLGEGGRFRSADVC